MTKTTTNILCSIEHAKALLEARKHTSGSRAHKRAQLPIMYAIKDAAKVARSTKLKLFIENEYNPMYCVLRAKSTGMPIIGPVRPMTPRDFGYTEAVEPTPAPTPAPTTAPTPVPTPAPTPAPVQKSDPVDRKAAAKKAAPVKAPTKKAAVKAPAKAPAKAAVKPATKTAAKAPVKAKAPAKTSAATKVKLNQLSPNKTDTHTILVRPSVSGTKVKLGYAATQDVADKAIARARALAAE